MRKLVFFLAFLTISNTCVYAFEFQGFQIQIPAGAEVPLVEYQTDLSPTKLALKFQVTGFMVPQKETYMFFGYAGLKLSFSDRLWFFVSPVATANFSTTEQFGAAIMLGINLAKNLFSIFIDSEAYFGHEDNNDYYGYYAADWNATGFMNIGAQVEQVNLTFSFGPHIEFTVGPWHGGPQLFIGYQEGVPVYNIRFLSAFSF